jgi:hypothetical protein
MREIQYEIVCSVREGFKRPNLVISVNLRQTENGPALSIIGMLGDSAGQIYKDIRRAECFNFRSGWTQEKLDKLLDVWGAYHLNDLQAGTPEQMEILRPWFETVKYPENTYDGQLCQLDKHGMRTHNGHVYGTKWLYLPIPADVLEFLHSL